MTGRFRAMEQPVRQPPQAPKIFWWSMFVTAAALITFLAFVVKRQAATWEILAAAGASVVGLVVTVAIPTWRDFLAADNEAQARQRVRQAEDKLSSELRGWDLIAAQVEQAVNDEDIIELARMAPETERRDDRLTLAALWDVTHGRMDLYHQIVTGQARNSFRTAQAAMGVGFVLLVVFAVLAAEAKTTTAAISAGGLGAVGAAFAAYIGKTFIRSQESAASHLRAYFDQPLELSRYLAAERLLADAKELTAKQRTAILSTLVQSIATAGQHDDKAKETKPRGRQPEGRGLR